VGRSNRSGRVRSRANPKEPLGDQNIGTTKRTAQRAIGTSGLGDPSDISGGRT
jgi:hypothetical protein